ncbi:MAG: PEP-CTERM sorting domain-containing protein [Acidobacteria bacterium]|nr:PEP-CTERM sorting domain-containing protein [Acidobacteriota bacterium]
MTRLGIRMVGVCACLLLGVGGGQASVLSPALVGGSIFFNLSPPPRVNFTTFGTHSLTGPGGLVQFTATPQPAPSLLAEVTAEAGLFNRSTGSLIYQMEVLGPGGSVAVSVQAAGSASASSPVGNPFSGFALKALWRFEDLSTASLLVNDEGINTPALTGSFSESFAKTYDMMLTVGHVYRVTLVADVGAGPGSSGKASGTAFIDPIFTFGPGVGPEFSFNLSDGIGNSGVPEPGTLGLMVAGALGIGVWRMRRG